MKWPEASLGDAGARSRRAGSCGTGYSGDVVFKAMALSSLYLLPPRETSMGDNWAGQVLTKWPFGGGPGATILAVSWW